MTAVEVRAAEKSFNDDGSRPVLDGIDLVLNKGTVTVLSGRSGTGKTTLLNLILGWEELDHGTVTVNSHDEGLSRLSWRDVAIVPQSPTLFPELTVEENITFPIRFHDRPSLPIDELLTALDLAKVANRRAERTSLGEQQRTAIARAIILRPDVLLADEPVAHQDRQHAQQSLELLRSVSRLGGACLIASHDPIVLKYADASVHLVDGELVGS